jgi:heat shock protein HtpX
MTRLFNNFKTAMLMALMFALIVGIGSIFGREGMIIAFVFALGMNFFAYFYSDKLALSAMGGQEVNEQTAPDLVRMVRRLSENAGIPMPRVYICPQEAPNAFATGRNPQNAAVAVTHGALTLLTYDELEGVMAHEIAHVKNRDTLISTIAGTVAGAISALVQFAQFAMIFGGGHRSNEGGANPFVMILAIILAPIAAMLIQMAISRSREYVADADAARIAGTPEGLISALRKLDAYAKRIPLEGAHESRAHQFIIKPLTGESLASLFSTHPATQSRIAALEDLRGTDLRLSRA